MAFFDDLGKKLSAAGQEVLQKTKDTAEGIKLNTQLAEEEKKIKKIYTEIGRLYYERFGDCYDACFEAAIEEINQAKAKIAKLNEQREKAKSAELCCPACGAKAEPDNLFCSSCGAKIEK